MPKNKGLGGKKRRKGKGATNFEKRELITKGVGQEYAQIVKSLGTDFMEVICFTNSGNSTKRGHIRGTMRKRVWLASGDIVLVNIRDFQDSTCDIILKYTPDEARLLRSKNVIPISSDVIHESINNDEDENEIVFENTDANNNMSSIYANLKPSNGKSASNDLDWCGTTNDTHSDDSDNSDNSLDSDDELIENAMNDYFNL